MVISRAWEGARSDARRHSSVASLRYARAARVVAIGVAATLWHMAWWIAVAFAGVVVVSQFVVFQVLVHSPKRASAPGQPR